MGVVHKVVDSDPSSTSVLVKSGWVTKRRVGVGGPVTLLTKAFSWKRRFLVLRSDRIGWRYNEDSEPAGGIVFGFNPTAAQVSRQGPNRVAFVHEQTTLLFELGSTKEAQAWELAIQQALCTASRIAAALRLPSSTVAAALPTLDYHCHAATGRGVWKALDLMYLLDGANLRTALEQAVQSDPNIDAEALCGALRDLPRRVLPSVGLGTFGLHTAFANATTNPVTLALRNGCRMLDFFDKDASGILFGGATPQNDLYRIGAGLHGAVDHTNYGSIDLSDLVLVSKADFTSLTHPGGVRQQLEATLEVMGLPSELIHPAGQPPIDVFMLHFPFGCTADYTFDKTVRIDAAWREMESLVDAGLVRTLGVCNFSTQQLDMLLSSGCNKIRPVAHELELHPFLRRTAHVEYAQRAGLALIAACPLANGQILDSEVLKHPTRTPAQQALSWSIAQGASVIPGAENSAQLLENLAMLRERVGASQCDLPAVATSLSVLAQTLPTLKQYMMEEGIFVREADGGLRCTSREAESQLATSRSANLITTEINAEHVGVATTGAPRVVRLQLLVGMSDGAVRLTLESVVTTSTPTVVRLRLRADTSGAVRLTLAPAVGLKDVVCSLPSEDLDENLEEDLAEE